MGFLLWALALLVLFVLLFGILSIPLRKKALKRIENELILDEEILMVCEKIFSLLPIAYALTNKGVIYALPWKNLDKLCEKVLVFKPSVLYEDMHEADLGHDIRIVLKDGKIHKLAFFKQQAKMFEIISYYIKHPQECM